MPISGRTVVQATIVLLAVGFLALLGIVAMTIWLGERSQVYFNDVIEARDIRSAAVELRSALQGAESSQRGYLATGNEIYLAPLDAAKARGATQLQNLKRWLAAYPGNEELVSRLSAVVAEKVSEIDRTIALKTNGDDAQALALLRTNRGKALMDEAEVYLSGIIRANDERLTNGVGEQRTNATLLRLVSIVGGLVIVLVVGGMTITGIRYTRELAQTRDEVSRLNTTLERRVEDRTAALAGARDRAEVLLAEVNHRVANSLTLLASLVKLQANTVTDKASKDALSETQDRIFAISLVHRRLYSSGDVRFVALDEYLSGLLDHLASSMGRDGHGASLRYDLAPLKLRTDASINLGIVVTEWVTNAFKYAYPDRLGEIRVRLTQIPDGRAELVVEDDGVGRKDGAPVQGSGLGTRIVKAVAGSLRGETEYLRREPGTAARLVFSLDSP
jgi:two-component sensor histidine kinase